MKTLTTRAMISLLQEFLLIVNLTLMCWRVTALKIMCIGQNLIFNSTNSIFGIWDSQVSLPSNHRSSILSRTIMIHSQTSQAMRIISWFGLCRVLTLKYSFIMPMYLHYRLRKQYKLVDVLRVEASTILHFMVHLI